MFEVKTFDFMDETMIQSLSSRNKGLVAFFVDEKKGEENRVHTRQVAHTGWKKKKKTHLQAPATYWENVERRTAPEHHYANPMIGSRSGVHLFP